MKFIIERTSAWRDEQPCEEATKLKFNNQKFWGIKINTIRELIEFMNKHKSELVIKFKKVPNADGFSTDEIPVIEIYDDYRE